MHTGNRTVSHYLFSEDVRSCHLQRQIRYACVTNTLFSAANLSICQTHNCIYAYTL